MSDLGAKLRQAREAKGLTLDDLFEQTKIQVRLLKALEEEEYHLFPGEVYARGALRNYAETVGLDYKEVLALYQGAQAAEEKAEPLAPQEKEKEKRETLQVIRPRRKPSRRRKPFLTFLLVLAILVSLVYLADLLLDSRDPGPVPDDPVTQDPFPDPEPDPDEPGEDPEPEPEPVITLEKPNPNREEYRLLGAETLELELSFRADCWLGVFIGDDRVSAGTYRRGQTFTYSSDRDLRVRLGNPGGVQSFLVNGQPINVRSTDRPYSITISLVKP